MCRPECPALDGLQDLEYMIEKCVSTDKADFAVVAGIQIHNWVDAGHSNEPNLEFIAPTKVYVVVGELALRAG